MFHYHAHHSSVSLTVLGDGKGACLRRPDWDGRLVHDVADRRMDMQDDLVVLADLWGTVQRHAGEERLCRDGGRVLDCAGGGLLVVTLTTKNWSVPTLSTASDC
jgi:hypothetical protein